nr:MFS transporter [Citricoccus sp. SGAir0253]
MGVPVRAHEWNATAALVFTCLLGALVQTIIVSVQADLPRLLDASREETAWAITATITTGCAVAPVAGRLGDLYGHRRVIVSLLGVFVVGSVVCGVAESVWSLIVGRALQGAAVGVIPVATSMLRNVVSGPRLPLAFAVVAGTMGVGSAFGIPLGAVLATHVDWRVMFWLCCVLGLGCVVWIRWGVPVDGPRPDGRFDVVGAAGSSLGAVAVLVGLSGLLVQGWDAPSTVVPAAVGLAVLGLTGVHLWYHRAPLINVRLALRPRLLLTNVASAAVNFGMMSMLVFFPQLLVLPPVVGGLGLGAGAASAIMAASGLAQLCVTPLSARLSRSLDPGRILALAALLLTLALVLGVAAGAQLWAVVLVLIAGGAAIGIALAAVPLVIHDAVSPSDIATAHGLNAQIRMFGTAAAAAAIGAVLASQTIAGAPTPAGFIWAGLTAAAATGVGAGLGFLIPRQAPEKLPHAS